MSLLPGTALEQALAALRAPSLFAQLRDRPLPDDVLLLLRLAAGDSQAREQAREASGEPEALPHCPNPATRTSASSGSPVTPMPANSSESSCAV